MKANCIANMCSKLTEADQKNTIKVPLEKRNIFIDLDFSSNTGDTIVKIVLRKFTNVLKKKLP